MMRLPSTVRFFSFLAVCLALGACASSGERKYCSESHDLETSAKLSTVQTRSGAVAGYIEDGVYTYKGPLNI